MSQSTFKYQITADDYLTHQLFNASLSPYFKKQRRRGLILWTSTFFILALIFYIQKNIYLAIYFSLFGLGFIFIYPIYSRWIYKRYYKRFVNKNFKESNLENLWLKLGDSNLVISNGTEEGQIPVPNIEKIYEIPTHIFIKLTEGKSVIIPILKIENTQELTDRITSLIKENNIEIEKYPNWKWR